MSSVFTTKGIPSTAKTRGRGVHDLFPSMQLGKVNEDGSSPIKILDGRTMEISINPFFAHRQTEEMPPEGVYQPYMPEIRHEPDPSIWKVEDTNLRDRLFHRAFCRDAGIVDDDQYVAGVRECQGRDQEEAAPHLVRTLGPTVATLFTQADLLAGWAVSCNNYSQTLFGLPTVEVMAGRGANGGYQYQWNEVTALGTPATLASGGTATDSEPTVTQRTAILERIAIPGSYDTLDATAAANYGSDLGLLERNTQLIALAQLFESKFFDQAENTTTQQFKGLYPTMLANKAAQILFANGLTGASGDDNELDANMVPVIWDQLYDQLKGFIADIHLMAPRDVRALSAITAAKVVWNDGNVNGFGIPVATYNRIPIIKSDGISVVDDITSGVVAATGGNGSRAYVANTGPQGLNLVTMRNDPAIKIEVASEIVNRKAKVVIMSSVTRGIRVVNSQSVSIMAGILKPA